MRICRNNKQFFFSPFPLLKGWYYVNKKYKLNLEIFRRKRTFFHGTTDTLPVKKVLLPPSATKIKREEWRTKYTDSVFFTDSLLSAMKYAKRACVKYGGNPVVYVVKPIGQFFNTIPGEYVADKALVLNALAQ